MKNIRVEKRVPFGFKGEWGQVYKSITRGENLLTRSFYGIRNYYVDIGQDVQFKYLEDGIDKQKFFFAGRGKYRRKKRLQNCRDDGRLL